LETIQPRFLPFETEPQLADHHAVWHQSRYDFLEKMRNERKSVAPVDQWQKRYYRGADMTDKPVVPDHRVKLRLAPFAPIPDETPAEVDPNAPVILQTDTATLGKVIGEIAAAIGAGSLESDPAVDALAKRLVAIELGESEALEVVLTAMAQAEPDGG
jgi:hypothetical protein